MTTTLLIFFVVLFLAYSNGANDNFKGVATLFGCGASSYRYTLSWATAATLAGSFAALYLSQKLAVSFSGKGLVPDSLVSETHFVIAVGLGAALAVYIATVTGFPVSTTHALMGGLVGAGVLSADGVNFGRLWEYFFPPLLLSPVASVLLTVPVYPLFKRLRRLAGIGGDICICVGGRDEIVEITPDGAAVLKSTGATLTMDQIGVCREKYSGSFIGISAQQILVASHFLTAGAVCFARGMNDAPKILGLLIAARFAGIKGALILIGIIMAVGGLLNAKKVAMTMSKGITSLNHEEGFTANLVTALLVLFASGFGFPVSTTHVSCGSLFGVGLVSKKAHWGMIGKIVMSWVITLPLAAILSGLIFWIGGRK